MPRSPAAEAAARPLRRWRRRARSRAEALLRETPPGRRLRLAMAVAELDRFAAGRRLRVLDAGAEEGLLCLRLAARHPDWTLVAVDRVLPPLRRGQAWARRDRRAVSFVQADLERWVAEGTVDAVVALECLMEMPDDRAALAVLAAALRSGGLLLAQVPTADWTPVLRGSERTWRREVRHGYDVADLRRALEGVGLTVVEVRGVFHRLTALAQDVRDAVRTRPLAVRLATTPLLLASVALERRGVRPGPPRAWFVVATKR